MTNESSAEREFRWTRTDTIRVIGGFLIGAALIVPELTNLIPYESFAGKVMEISALVPLGQATFPFERLARS